MSNKTTPILLVVLLVGISLLGTFTLNGCGLFCDVGKYMDTLSPYLAEWDDAVNLANSTPRMSLASQIESLQSIRREISGLEIQSCLIEVHDLLIKSLDFQIEGFISFLGQASDAITSEKFRQSDDYLDKWSEAIKNK